MSTNKINHLRQAFCFATNCDRRVCTYDFIQLIFMYNEYSYMFIYFNCEMLKFKPNMSLQ